MQKLIYLVSTILAVASWVHSVNGQYRDTLLPLSGEQAPTGLDGMWRGFDPQAEPLEIETIQEWETEGVVLRIVRFRVGVFKGQVSRLAAVYGFPKSANSENKVPGLLQIHGGGQYADHKACLSNAKRGYATLSIAWAGRISAPDYRVNPEIVKLFWDAETQNPKYKLTTDWGAVDAYHAPSRFPQTVFPSVQSTDWTIDSVESPRNSPWFLCALAARRGLTFLQRQPEVDADKLGVYGHSMGGKLTVMASVDPRVKAAAPSCGGISDRDNASRVFVESIADPVSLKEIECPIFFLSPANDFHGRLGDLPSAIREIRSPEWRITASPHLNHRDLPEHFVATQLWFDEHLKGSFNVPASPSVEVELQTDSGIPRVVVTADDTREIVEVEVYFTQDGKTPELPSDREDTMTRFWQFVSPNRIDEEWAASIPLNSIEKPVWIYANVHYKLEEPVSGVGYYYESYSADTFCLSSLPTLISSDSLKSAKCKAVKSNSLTIETFENNWAKEWFTYNSTGWSISTHKIGSGPWKAPANSCLGIEVQSDEANELVVVLDQHVATVPLSGGGEVETIQLSFEDFIDIDGKPLTNWLGLRTLKLCPMERLRNNKRGAERKTKSVGKAWTGAPPKFHKLFWAER